jgi:hypothetical protein
MKKTGKHSITSVFFSRLRLCAVFSGIICHISAISSLAGSNNSYAWQKAESDDQYPQLYSGNFIDSIAKSEKTYIALNMRSIDTFLQCKGEKLVYEIGWGPLKAGFAILNSQPGSTKGTVEITGKGATNSFFSGIYKVRDCYRTIIDANGFYPLFFDQHIREGGYKADRWDFYDQVNNRVYTNRKKPEFYPNNRFAHSLLSCVYFMRTLDFEPGQTFYIDCFVDTMCHLVSMKCLERKKITVDAGTFSCLLVKPHLPGKGRIFSKKDNIEVWLTDDFYKMPVLIESKITWGTLHAKLVWYSRKE